MHSRQPPRDPKTGRMPSHPGAQPRNSRGARCFSVWIITIVLPHQCGDIQDTSTYRWRRVGLSGPACPRRGELVCRAVDMRHISQGAGRVPGQESWLPAGPHGQHALPLLVGPQRAQSSLKANNGASLEELPPPFPVLGPSFLEALHGVKAHWAIPHVADLLLVSAGTHAFTEAGRGQLPAKSCSTGRYSKGRDPPPAGGTDSPGAHLVTADEPKGTSGSRHAARQ